MDDALPHAQHWFSQPHKNYLRNHDRVELREYFREQPDNGNGLSFRNRDVDAGRNILRNVIYASIGLPVHHKF